jgi:subtilisin family serine protease
MSGSGVKLVNMSFSGPQDDLVQVRIKTMRERGFVFTAAAGNEGPAATPTYPAAYPEVVAVTAVTKDLHVYPSANRGAQIDLAAPGVGIWTAAPDAREGYRTGTSFATPFATAVLALQRPDTEYASKDELLDHLKTVGLGPPGRNPIYGRGLVQAPSECPGSGSLRR